MVDDPAENRRLRQDELRQALRQRRRALPAGERLLAAEHLASRLLSLPFSPTSGHVAGYWAMDGEIALHAWQVKLPGTCTYCLPVLCPDQKLRFAPWRPGEPLLHNRFGIPEPDVPTESLVDASQLAFAVMPLVGFDASGQRLGMGGGWYDRSFAMRHQQPGPPWLVGAAFSIQQVEQLDVADWDVRPDAICTESRTHDDRLAPPPPQSKE